LARTQFDAGPPAVMLNDFLADCQSDSSAGVFLSGVQSPEHHKNLIVAFRFDSDTDADPKLK
jgi:hypothetical protein